MLSSWVRVPPSRVGLVDAGNRWVEVVRSRTSPPQVSTDFASVKKVSVGLTGFVSVRKEVTCLASDRKASDDPPRKKLSLLSNRSVREGSIPPVSAEIWRPDDPIGLKSVVFPLKMVVVESGRICVCCGLASITNIYDFF